MHSSALSIQFCKQPKTALNIKYFFKSLECTDTTLRVNSNVGQGVFRNSALLGQFSCEHNQKIKSI